MNVFRLAGDMTHLFSVVVLLLKIYATKSCSGISLKTQELFVLVFLTRYLDLFTDFISLYNTVMKLVFLSSSVAIVWCMRGHVLVRRSYDNDQDTFRHYFLVAGSSILALLVHDDFTLREIFFFTMKCCLCELPSMSLFLSTRGSYSSILVAWAFSIYLEAVAVLPQLVLLQRSGNVDNLTGQYVFLLGAYRAFYVLNWIYRFFAEEYPIRWISWVSALVQTALYADFLYYYILSWKNNVKLKLPA